MSFTQIFVAALLFGVIAPQAIASENPAENQIKIAQMGQYVPPEISACQGKPAGAECTYLPMLSDTGVSGTCHADSSPDGVMMICR